MKYLGLLDSEMDFSCTNSLKNVGFLEILILHLNVSEPLLSGPDMEYCPIFRNLFAMQYNSLVLFLFFLIYLEFWEAQLLTISFHLFLLLY